MTQFPEPDDVLAQFIAGAKSVLGTVGSKREAADWAVGALDPEWQGLIQQALDDRPDPWGRVKQDSTPELVARTRAFADMAVTAI